MAGETLLIRSRGPSLFVNPNKKGILGVWRSCVQAHIFVSEKTHLNDNDCGKGIGSCIDRVGGGGGWGEVGGWGRWGGCSLGFVWTFKKQKCLNPCAFTYRDLSLFWSVGVSRVLFHWNWVICGTRIKSRKSNDTSVVPPRVHVIVRGSASHSPGRLKGHLFCHSGDGVHYL